MSTWNEPKKTANWKNNKSRGSRRVSGFHVRLNRGIEAKDLNCVLFSEEIANIDNRIKVVHAFNEIHIHNMQSWVANILWISLMIRILKQEIWGHVHAKRIFLIDKLIVRKVETDFLKKIDFSIYRNYCSLLYTYAMLEK